MDVVLISLDSDLSELINLTESLNYNIDKIFVQNLKGPNPKYFIGKGKVNEIAEYTRNNKIELIIFNARLKASQLFNLERVFKIKIFDRIRLILEIFTDRAHSREAKLQVELAKLQYEIPLVNEWVHRSKKGEHPGLLAGGEYAVQQYYDMIRKRIKKNKDKLQRLTKERDFRRGHRKKYGFYLVSLAGYTNAGKSTLLNKLTDSNVIVEKRVFSTLTTTTRKIIDSSRQVLLTDTVGFIKDLPPWLIEAFNSTLEEIFYSDIILLIIDINEDIDEIIKKINTCFQILWNSDNVPTIIPVLNKIDLDNIQNVREKINNLQEQNLIDDHIYISAKENLFLDNLIDKIYLSLPELKQYRIEIYTSEAKSIINFLKKTSNIIKINEIEMTSNPSSNKNYDGNRLDKKIVVDFECNEKNEVQIKKRSTELSGIKLIPISEK
jgi:GTP-binding protein HflX